MSATLCIAHLWSKPWPLEIVGIPFTDQCELFIQRSRVNDVHCFYMHYFETLRPSSACWWWCEAVHVPIMRSAVLCGSHSGDLVPDLHGSVAESRDIEILATHVSHHECWTVVICDGQPDLSIGVYFGNQGYTVISWEKNTKHAFSK